MRDAINPQVQRAIVHLINHKTQDLVLSDEELTLAGNDKLREYFSKQVKNVLSDGQTGTARFSAEGEQSAIKEAYKIIGQPKQFVPSSQALAKSLFTAMGTDARIKPASLAVCQYNAENYSKTKFLALIKIDPTEVFVERVKTVKEKTVVTFEEIPDALPTAREKLQKAALIPPKDMVESLDLLLLDKQVPGVAEFFAVKFLNTQPGLDPRDSTRRIWEVGQRAHNVLVSSAVVAEAHLTPEQADTLTQHWEVATQSEVIDLEQLVSELPLPEEAQTTIRKEIEKEFPNETQIKIDPQYAKAKLTKKRRFRGDFGVLFEVESDHYDDVVLEKNERNEPDGRRITRLIIEVPDLRWVK